MKNIEKSSIVFLFIFSVSSLFGQKITYSNEELLNIGKLVSIKKKDFTNLNKQITNLNNQIKSEESKIYASFKKLEAEDYELYDYFVLNCAFDNINFSPKNKKKLSDFGLITSKPFNISLKIKIFGKFLFLKNRNQELFDDIVKFFAQSEDKQYWATKKGGFSGEENKNFLFEQLKLITFNGYPKKYVVKISEFLIK